MGTIEFGLLAWEGSLAHVQSGSLIPTVPHPNLGEVQGSKVQRHFVVTCAIAQS